MSASRRVAPLVRLPVDFCCWAFYPAAPQRGFSYKAGTRVRHFADKSRSDNLLSGALPYGFARLFLD